MSEPREVRPVLFGTPDEKQLDLRPVSVIVDSKPEEVKPKAPKVIASSTSSQPAQVKLQSEGDESQKSQTPGSRTSTEGGTQESSSVSDAQSSTNAKSDGASSESGTDSGADSTKPIEEKTTSTTKSPSTPAPPAPIAAKK